MKRKHHDTIVAWANGADVYMRKNASEKWKFTADPAFIADYEYCTELPREYPKTTMTDNELNIIEDRLSRRDTSASEDRRDLVNHVICHAIDNGQVVTREEFDCAIGDRKARDWLVAEAVMNECKGEHRSWETVFRTPDIAATIAKVGK
jgi:hypothetical protein